jgi:hypothetical protein
LISSSCLSGQKAARKIFARPPGAHDHAFAEPVATGTHYGARNRFCQSR